MCLRSKQTIYLRWISTDGISKWYKHDLRSNVPTKSTKDESRLIFKLTYSIFTGSFFVCNVRFFFSLDWMKQFHWCKFNKLNISVNRANFLRANFLKAKFHSFPIQITFGKNCSSFFTTTASGWFHWILKWFDILKCSTFFWCCY